MPDRNSGLQDHAHASAESPRCVEFGRQNNPSAGSQRAMIFGSAVVVKTAKTDTAASQISMNLLEQRAAEHPKVSRCNQPHRDPGRIAADRSSSNGKATVDTVQSSSTASCERKEDCLPINASSNSVSSV